MRGLADRSPAPEHTPRTNPAPIPRRSRACHTVPKHLACAVPPDASVPPELSAIPAILIQLTGVVTEAIGGCRTSTAGILPLCLRGEAVSRATLSHIKSPDKLLRILPGHLLHRAVTVACELTRIRPHHRFPLPLRDCILPQIKRLADGHLMDRLLSSSPSCDPIRNVPAAISTNSMPMLLVRRASSPVAAAHAGRWGSRVSWALGQTRSVRRVALAAVGRTPSRNWR